MNSAIKTHYSGSDIKHSPQLETRVHPQCARYRFDRLIQNADGSRGTGTDNSMDRPRYSQDDACRCPQRTPRCGQCLLTHHRLCACPRAEVAGSDRRGAWMAPDSPAIAVCPCGTATNPD